MTKRKKSVAVELPPEELGRYQCNDCGVNVVTVGEFYMLHLDIWEDQLGLGWDDNLCIGCLEKRLGRKVSLVDMCSIPNYPWMKPRSIRLMHQLFGNAITKRPPYRVSKRSNLGGMTKALAKQIGEYGANEVSA